MLSLSAIGIDPPLFGLLHGLDDIGYATSKLRVPGDDPAP
jgi:hypothetical protein